MYKKIIVATIILGIIIMNTAVIYADKNSSVIDKNEIQQEEKNSKALQPIIENKDKEWYEEKTDEIERLNNLIQLNTPKIKKIYPDACCVSIIWDKVDDASYYEVYKKVKKKWIIIKKTKNISCLAFNGNKKTYLYRVKAFLEKPNGNKIESKYSKSKKCRNDVKIGQACAGERGLTNNRPGDQTGREVKISDWKYGSKKKDHFHWTFVVRCKDPEKRAIVAKTVRDACNNKLVGYDMNKGDRITLWKESKKKNWNVGKIEKNCETSCTRVACVGLAAAGLTNFPKDIDSYNLMKEASKFKDDLLVLTAKKYLTSPMYLRKGDILCCGPYHTAVVL